MEDTANIPASLGLTAVAESLLAPASAPEAPAGSAAAPGAASTAFRSDAQYLLDRYADQCTRILGLHRRLLVVRGQIVATPAPSAALSKVEEPKPKGVAFFAGLAMIADADDAAIEALEADIEQLAKLF